MENREVGSKIGLILFSIFLFILLIVPVSAITLHPEDAELDTSIVVTQTNPIAMFFRELKLSLLSIGARVAGGEYKASFTTEEAVYLEGDSIAWNTDCSNTYMVIELYKKTGSCPSGWTKTGLDCYIAKRSSSWSQVGLPPSQYSEDKFYHRWSANFGKLPEGDYEAVNYIYCGSTSSCISIECQTPNVADFSVKEEGSDCKEEFVGGRQCRATYSGHEDVYRRKQFEDCHEEYVLVETCPVCDGCYCNAGQCIGGGTPTCDNDGKCESGENAGNCPNDCGGTGPYCGDGKCESGENAGNCPNDCGGGGDDSYLWYIIIFGVIILLIGGYFYFRDNG